MQPARIKAYLALILCALIWGAAQPVVKPALSYVTPLQYMGLRYLVALPVAIGAFIYLYKKHKPSPKMLLTMLIIEFFVVLNLLLLYTGLKYTTALQSALILNSRPVFITFMGILLLREREETHEWAGLFLSLLGTFMVILSPVLNHSLQGSLPPHAMWGNILVVGTNIVTMIITFFVKKHYTKVSKPLISSVNVIFGMIIFLALNLATTGSLPINALAIPSVALAVLYMGILGTMLAISLELYGYAKIEASEASLFQYLEPLVYVPLAILWLKEPVSPFQIAGLGIILAGVTIAAMRLPKRHFGKPKLSLGKVIDKNLRLSDAPYFSKNLRFH